MKKIVLGLMSLLTFIFPSINQVPLPVHANDIAWTNEEANYIATHPTLTFGVDPEFYPFEFVENGTYKGIASDYINIIAERTGINFVRVENLSWVNAYNQILSGQIDFAPALSKTSEREQFLAFSDMYQEVRRVIVKLNGNQEILDFGDLAGKRVGVQRNSSHHTFLENEGNITLKLYDTVIEGLNAVSDGEDIAFVGNLATVTYFIRTNSITNLQLIGIESAVKVGIHFATIKSNTVLIGIFNKALATITSEERLAISSRWISVEFPTDYGPLIQTIIAVSIFIVVLGLVSWFWIYRLNKEVKYRRIVQVELEDAKKIAEEANEVKSTFLARMSHEIRTPLNAITGMSYLIKKSNVTLAQRMYVDRISQASQTMLSLINDVLDYSKIEANKIELEMVSFNLDQVVHNLMSIMAGKIEDKGLTFRFIKDSEIPLYFIGDPKRLEQILLNLLNNAVKFTAKGGVTLEIRQEAREGDLHHLTFSIHDTGIGMSKQVQEQLFTPFTQADSSINRRFGGSGLGLSIVKFLVELMGGKVKVFSSEGEGSTFVVNLTFKHDKTREMDEKIEASGEFLSQVRALVLDKSTANLNILETYLHSFGIECELTTSQNAASSLLEKSNGELKSPYDLLIIDYDTPKEKGLDFVTHLRANSIIKKQPKILMLIPMSRMELFDQLTNHGVDIGIGKPVISSILHNALLELFFHKVIAITDSHLEDSAKTIVKLDKKILVVDDNNTNQLIARLLLEQAGFDVITAGDGKEAVDIFIEQSRDIALILMDIHMPVMNGYDAAKKIHDIMPTTRIVAMTAEVTPGVKENCLAAGMKHYIAKPFEPEQFIKEIHTILHQDGHTSTHEVALLDSAKAIRDLGNNADLYVLVVKEYYHENELTNEKLKKAVVEANYLEARNILHKIKGSSGAIGAEMLVNQIAELQKAIMSKEEQEISIQLEKFTNLLAKILDHIHEHYVTKEGHPDEK